MGKEFKFPCLLPSAITRSLRFADSRVKNKQDSSHFKPQREKPHFHVINKCKVIFKTFVFIAFCHTTKILPCGHASQSSPLFPGALS